MPSNGKKITVERGISTPIFLKLIFMEGTSSSLYS